MSSGIAHARLTPQLLEPVFQRLEQRVRAGEVPGAALAVADAQGTIDSRAFALRADDRVESGAHFFLASLTKPIFATALMQLVEEGRLHLDAPVASYVPEFSGGGRETVTTWHLLTHTSGVPDTPPALIRDERPSAKRMTELALTSPLRFAPGTRWEYCSASFYVMGEVMSRVSGLSYREFLQQRLFDPLEMSTTFDPRRNRRQVVPVQGVGADNAIKRYLLLRYVASIAQPGGGLFGTLEDILRFGGAVLGPRRTERGYLPLAPETIALMSEDHTRGLPGVVEGEERRVHFGLGWNKPTLMGGLPGSPAVIGHGGATGTSLWIDPVAGLVFVYFTNQWAPDRLPELEALRGVYDALKQAGGGGEAGGAGSSAES
ncbi:MAG TPA: serine hydrolase domain-containing protein [Candidatus Limnocylindria bacterium]|nr:serine hydrolase domain-containing protein [Candidatus Limnocylindria bacterium]